MHSGFSGGARRAEQLNPQPLRELSAQAKRSTDTSVALANIVKRECAGGEDGSFASLPPGPGRARRADRARVVVVVW